jgi:hypothetical protein
MKRLKYLSILIFLVFSLISIVDTSELPDLQRAEFHKENAKDFEDAYALWLKDFLEHENKTLQFKELSVKSFQKRTREKYKKKARGERHLSIRSINKAEESLRKAVAERKEAARKYILVRDWTNAAENYEQCAGHTEILVNRRKVTLNQIKDNYGNILAARQEEIAALFQKAERYRELSARNYRKARIFDKNKINIEFQKSLQKEVKELLESALDNFLNALKKYKEELTYDKFLSENYSLMAVMKENMVNSRKGVERIKNKLKIYEHSLN